MNTRFLLSLFSIVILSVSFSCIKEKEDDYPYLEHEIEVGDPVPVFTVYERENGAGASFLSTECKGKVTVLVFFNTGCKDCQRELPKIEYVYKALQDDPIYQVITIARDQGEEEVKTYWTDSKVNFTMPAFVDPGRKVFTLFANQTVPRIYIVNPDGFVSWMAIEYLNMEKEEFLEVVREMK